MKRQIIAALGMLALYGCRAADTPFRAESLTGRYGYTAEPHLDERSVAAEPTLPPSTSGGQLAQRGLHPVVFQSPAAPVFTSDWIEPIPLPPTDFPLSDLSLLDFEGIAIESNPVLAQMSALVVAAEGKWLQAGLAPNPTVGYSGQQLGSGGVAEQHGVYVGQQLITGRKLSLERQIAAWEIQRARQELEAARLRVLTDVRVSYYDLLIAQRRRDLATELTAISERAVATAESLFRGEEVSEADPLRARVEADSARIVLETATSQLHEAWRRLTAVTGMPDLEIARIQGELEPDQLDRSWDESLARILVASPELAAAIADVESARWAVERQYAEVIPNIDVQAVVQDDHGTGSTNGNLQISLPIPILNRNQGGIQRACAEAVAAERAIDRLALDLQARLAVVFQRFEAARYRVTQYSRNGGILENADRTLALIRAGYQGEEFSVLELLSAQRTYFQTNLDYLDSLQELWASHTEMRGMLLRDSLPSN